MKTVNKIILACLGVAGLALAVEPSQAQTIEVNGNGSSAGRLFAALTPSFVCDTGTQASFFFDTALASGPSNRTEWQCKVGGASTVFRYLATASADGYLKTNNPVLQTVSYLNTADPGCVLQATGAIGGHPNVNQFLCSANPNNVTKPVHYGASDVKAASFGQTAFGSTQAIPASGSVTANPTVVVPFAIVVGSGVTAGGGGALTTLSRLELQAIFSGAVLNWTDLGHDTTSTNKAIVTCQRTVGSGTLATLDQTIMHGPGITAINPVASATNIANAGSSNMKTCIQNNANAIGYIDSDTVPTLSSGYQVAIDGVAVNNPALPLTDLNRVKNLRCGKYPYWADWNIITRNSGVDGLAIPGGGTVPVGTNAMIQTYLTAAGNNNPLPGFWVKESDMFVFKNDDKGPHNFLGGVGTNCQS